LISGVVFDEDYTENLFENEREALYVSLAFFSFRFFPEPHFSCP
jgi:hypothetical protein